MAGHDAADPIRGLAVAEDGLRLSLAATSLPRGTAATLRFAIDDADGPVRDFEVTHEKRMHLIVVRRDGTRLPAPAPDARRRRHLERADHAARRGRLPRVRGLQARRRARTRSRRDLTVDGAADLRAVPGACDAAPTTDGYTVELDAATATRSRFAITRDGRPVETEPYLGAGGHLVALREGDLAFLHVHPDRATASSSRPSSTRTRRYRLYLQFKHAGRGPHRGVHAMSTTIELPITGMTCASCANRIERKLNKLDGVQRDRQLRDREGDRRLRPGGGRARALVGAVEAAGYHAALPTAEPRAESEPPTRPRRCASG